MMEVYDFLERIAGSWSDEEAEKAKKSIEKLDKEDIEAQENES